MRASRPSWPARSVSSASDSQRASSAIRASLRRQLRPVLAVQQVGGGRPGRVGADGAGGPVPAGARAGGPRSHAQHPVVARHAAGGAAQHQVHVDAADAHRADAGQPAAGGPLLGHLGQPERGVAARAAADAGRTTPVVGGMMPVPRASTVLISPAAPAAALACPMLALIEPSAAVCAGVGAQLGQRGELGLVGGQGATAVTLDEPDIARGRRWPARRPGAGPGAGCWRRRRPRRASRRPRCPSR